MSKTDATGGESTAAPENSETKDAFDSLMGEYLPEDEPEAEEPVEAAEEEEPAVEEPETDEDEEDEPEEAVEKTPRRRKSPKKRIETLLSKNRELEAELAALKAAQEAPAPKARTAPVVTDEGPDPEALNEDGTPVYPLGDLDRAYIRDVVRFETEKRDRELAAKEQEQREKAEQAAIATQWSSKLDEAEEENPGLRDQIAELEETFLDLDPAYGQHIALTIMSLDNGPQVLHYLAQNLDEAETILEMGPSRATVALGRLDARFDSAIAPVTTKRTTKAPPPPPSRTRGTGARVDTGSSVYDKMLREFR